MSVLVAFYGLAIRGYSNIYNTMTTVQTPSAEEDCGGLMQQLLDGYVVRLFTASKVWKEPLISTLISSFEDFHGFRFKLRKRKKERRLLKVENIFYKLDKYGCWPVKLKSEV